MIRKIKKTLACYFNYTHEYITDTSKLIENCPGGNFLPETFFNVSSNVSLFLNPTEAVLSSAKL